MPQSSTPGWFRRSCAGLTAILFLLQTVVPASAAGRDTQTLTPIKHVIVIIGENRTFDHMFATYKPPKGQFVSNLLSKGIIKEDGTPGSNFGQAAQFAAVDHVPSPYMLSPGNKKPFKVLPPPNTDGTPGQASDTDPAPFATWEAAFQAEPDLERQNIGLLLTGASGLPHGVVDTRFQNVYHLPNGPFAFAPGVGYDDYAGSPVHRFYQMWQQSDCDISHATTMNPSGCLNDLYPWVEITIGAGSNGNARPNPFTEETTGEGATSMEFYNVTKGDMPYFTNLARTYALSDNFHQSVMGGTGANHVMIGAGDAIWFSDGKGNPETPVNEQIENPDPQANTNNWYMQDGYSGGTYSNCSDNTQPGVPAVLNYLASLPYKPNPNCDPKHYYLLNNYAPGYFGDGTVNTGEFVIPPSTLRNIGDELLEQNITWRYYGGGWNLYLADPNYNNTLNRYCDICNPFQYSTSIMTNQTVRQEHLKDVLDLYNDISEGTLPAVSFVKPDGFLDGHPASSKMDLFEAFTKKIIDQLQSNQKLWSTTAVVITMDEGGGYWDSGYQQPLDFFGDGPRIPTIVVSPYSTGGRVVHDYYDHVSLLKFIEKNWGLSPLTSRSRDNLPNPKSDPSNPYVPTNSPAIGDLMGMFQFN
jgi:phospholipase C